MRIAQEYFDSKSSPSNSGTSTSRSSGQTITYGGGTSGIMSPSPTYPAPIPIPSYDLLGKINIKDPARLLAEVNRLIDSVDYLTCLNGTALFSGGGGDGKVPEGFEKVPNKIKGEKSGTIDLSKFSKRVRRSNRRADLEDPKSGYFLSPERALNSGSGPHKGFWKLFDKAGRRIGTISRNGKFLGK